MSYVTENGRFNASFYCTDHRNPFEDEFEGMNRLTLEALGDRPAQAEPMPEIDLEDGDRFELSASLSLPVGPEFVGNGGGDP